MMLSAENLQGQAYFVQPRQTLESSIERFHLLLLSAVTFALWLLLLTLMSCALLCIDRNSRRTDVIYVHNEHPLAPSIYELGDKYGHLSAEERATAPVSWMVCAAPERCSALAWVQRQQYHCNICRCKHMLGACHLLWRPLARNSAHESS